MPRSARPRAASMPRRRSAADELPGALEGLAVAREVMSRCSHTRALGGGARHRTPDRTRLQLSSEKLLCSNICSNTLDAMQTPSGSSRTTASSRTAVSSGAVPAQQTQPAQVAPVARAAGRSSQPAGLTKAMSPGVVDYLFRQLVTGESSEDVQWQREGVTLSAQPPGAELARRLAETDLEALTPVELFHYIRASQRLAAWAEGLREAAVARYCQPAAPPPGGHPGGHPATSGSAHPHLAAGEAPS